MIKNLVFDFGDVFINLDKDAPVKELKRLGINEISNEMIEIAKQFEIGAFSSWIWLYIRLQVCWVT